MNKKLITCYNTEASRLIGETGKAVFPKKIEQVQSIIKTPGLDIVPRGAGTGLVGGTIPYNSLVVDMGKMDNVSDFNPIKKIVHVEPGVTLKELNEKLAAVGFEFPIQSFNNGISTIGGMIARNALGGIKYGEIKDWIEEIEFVNGRGELTKTSKADLMDVCGMEGITGIIVGATLRIVQKTKKTASIFQTESLDEVLSIARRLKLEKEVVVLTLFSPEISKLLGFSEKYNLMIEFDSNRGKIKGKEYEKISKLRGNIYSVFYSKEYYSSEDFKFFFDKLKEFILHLETSQIPYFALLGLGVIRPFFRDSEKDKKKEVVKLINRINAKPGDYGIGLTRKYLLDSFETKVIKRVKLRYDPFGRLNKGKVIEADVQMDKYTSREEAQHIQPIQKEEIEEIKPFIGEEISASEFKEEVKTPEEDMKKFIEKAELIEKKEREEFKKPEERLEKKVPINETEELLKDYEQTYDSELPEKRRKKIEDFAKGVPRRVSEVKKRGKLSKEEQDAVNKVMMGGFGLNNKDKEEENNNE